MRKKFEATQPRAKPRGASEKLTAEREQELTRRWKADGDGAALSELIRLNRYLVVGVARRYRGLGLPFDDLVQEGNAALVHAANRFDPDRGFRFSTYATWWVRAAIQDYVIDNRSVVKRITSGRHRSLFFGLQRLRYTWKVEGKLDGDERERAAAAMGVPLSTIDELEAFLCGTDQPAVDEIDPGEKNNGVTLVAPDPSPEEAVSSARERRDRRAWLRAALGGLNERERIIILGRHLSDSPRTLSDLGSRFGVSPERARQIESAALSKLRGWAAASPLAAIGTEAGLAGA